MNYKVGMVIAVSSATQSSRRLKIKRVISETQFYVGEENTNITTYTDLSAFLVADAATVVFGEDKRPVIDVLEIQRQVYEEEPTVALRSHSVDWLGRSYTKENPIPTQIGNGVDSAVTTTNDGPTITGLDTNIINKLINLPHDDIEILTKTIDGDPLTIAVRNLGVQIMTLSLSYDNEGIFQRVRRLP